MKYAFTHGKLLDGTKDMQVPHMMADQSVFREPLSWLRPMEIVNLSSVLI